MNDNEVGVLLLSVSKTKNGKSILNYAMEGKETSYSKGLVVLSQWFDNDKLFNNLSKEDMAKPCIATYDYEQTYNGLARQRLLTIVNSDGKDLLA